MKLKKLLYYILVVTLVFSNACSDSILDVTPGDKLTSANFPTDEKDLKLLLNGIYARLNLNLVVWEGIYPFGLLDGATPNCYNWVNTDIDKMGKGEMSSSDTGFLTDTWTRCYSIIFRANYLLRFLDEMEITEDVKAVYKGEAHFMRGLAYSNLVNYFGGVPIVLSAISPEEARTITRASEEESWNQVIADYNVAIANLGVNAPEVGRATKGAALGMKMRAYLYQNKFQEVLQVVSEIEALGKYSLFPTYDGLFKLANENNQEVMFDVQYIIGENEQGSRHDQFCGTGTGTWTRGSRYVPTEDLINAYERIDGSPGKYTEWNVDLDNPYEGWDPRMRVTCIVPGAYYLGYRFPNYLYPGGAYNHPGCALKHFSSRKYRVEPESDLAPATQSQLNFIVLRYADVILSKAEALIETGGSIAEAVTLINQIRTGREDVNLSPLPSNLTREEAREKLRHERRIEFALEGLYWSDIKRWDIAKDLYPLEIRDHKGNIIETKFPNGYLDHYRYMPIPDSEISLNENLTQNPGW